MKRFTLALVICFMTMSVTKAEPSLQYASFLDDHRLSSKSWSELDRKTDSTRFLEKLKGAIFLPQDQYKNCKLESLLHSSTMPALSSNSNVLMAEDLDGPEKIMLKVHPTGDRTYKLAYKTKGKYPQFLYVKIADERVTKLTHIHCKRVKQDLGDAKVPECKKYLGCERGNIEDHVDNTTRSK